MSKDLIHIIERIKKIKDIQSKSAVAKLLGMSKENLNGYLSRNTLPLEAILLFCEKENISPTYLLYGTEKIPTREKIRLKYGMELPPEQAPEGHLPPDQRVFSGITDPKTAEILQLTREIMESGTSYAEALSTNVIHFHRAVKVEEAARQKTDEMTEGLAGVVKRLEKVVEDMQKTRGPTFREIIDLAGGHFSLQTVLRVFLERIMQTTGAKIGSILLKNPVTGNFQVAVAKSEDNGPKKDEIINIESSVMRIAVDEKKPVLVDDIETDPQVARPNKPRYGSPSFMSVPIMEKDECRGVINLAGKDPTLKFNRDDQDIVVKLLPEIMAALTKHGGLPNGIFNH